MTGKRIAVHSTHVPVQLPTRKILSYLDWVESAVQQIAFPLLGMSQLPIHSNLKNLSLSNRQKRRDLLTNIAYRYILLTSSMVQADLSTNLVLSSCCSVSACSHFAVRLATVLAARLDVEEWIFVTLDPATLRTKTFSRSGLGRSSIVVRGSTRR